MRKLVDQSACDDRTSWRIAALPRCNESELPPCEDEVAAPAAGTMIEAAHMTARPTPTSLRALKRRGPRGGTGDGARGSAWSVVVIVSPSVGGELPVSDRRRSFGDLQGGELDSDREAVYSR